MSGEIDYDVSIHDTGRWNRNCTFSDYWGKWCKKVIVNFERPVENGFNSARCELPDYKWTVNEGYSDEEIAFFEKISA